MAIRSAAYGTFNQTVGVKLDMDDAIRMLTPTDVPLQQWLPTDTTNEVKVEWLEEDLLTQAVVVTSFTGTGPYTITVPDTSELRVNDILWDTTSGVAAQQYLVTSITSSTVFVASDFGTNTTDPTNADTLTIIGQYVSEGADPQAPRSNERLAKFNYTQIGQEQVAATRTARARGSRGGLYGQMDPYTHEVSKKFKELAIRFERSLVLGQRAISGGADQRFMGGLFYYISTNTSSGVKANAKTLINDLLKLAYDSGSSAQTLMVSPAVKRAISDNIDPTLRRIDRTDATAGFVVDHFNSDFGEIDIVMNRHFPKTKGLLLDRQDLARVVFDGYFHELLAKTGDSDKGEIVGEQSLRVKNDKAHGILTLTDA